MKFITKTYRYIAINLAFLMFCTSIGFAVDMHFCKGDFKSFSFLEKAPSCHEVATTVTCPHHQKMMKEAFRVKLGTGCLDARLGGKEDNRNCCKNKTVHIEANQDLQIQFLDLLSLHYQATLAFVQNKVLYQNLYITQTSLPFQHYKPPLLFRDVPVLIQSFLC